MDATIGKVFDSVSTFFSGVASGSSDEFPLCDTDIISVEPEWRQAQTLKTAIEDRIVKDGVIGVGIAVTAVGIVAGIAAALIRSG